MESVAVWIQAIASCILFVVTGIYVWFTKKLMEANGESFISVEELANPSFMGCRIKVINNGPGHAIKLKVIVGLNSLTKTLRGDQLITQEVVAIGPSVLMAGKEATFEVNDPEYGIKEKTPIFIIYQTQAGKRYIYEWERTIGGEDPPVKFIGKRKKVKINQITLLQGCNNNINRFFSWNLIITRDKELILRSSRIIHSSQLVINIPISTR